MSVKKKQGRLLKKNTFDILPYVIKRNPKFEPKEVLGDDLANKYRNDMKKAFKFLSYGKVKRDVMYSTKEYKFKCLWCGKELTEIGMNIEELIKNHSKGCRFPMFTIQGKPGLIKTSVKNNDIEKQITIYNNLTEYRILYKLKKTKWKEYNFLLDVVRKRIRMDIKNNEVIVNTMNIYGDKFYIKK